MGSLSSTAERSGYFFCVGFFGAVLEVGVKNKHVLCGVKLSFVDGKVDVTGAGGLRAGGFTKVAGGREPFFNQLLELEGFVESY